MLNWRSLNCPASRELVKGSRLAVALYGPQSRFAIYEIRTREADGMPGLRFAVADAEAISDAEIRQGKTAPFVFNGNEPDECVAFCDDLLGRGL